MTGISIEVSERVPAPPETVWRLITDWEHQDDWMLEASDFVVTSAHRAGIGVEAEATIKIAGISTRDRVRVVGWEPPTRLAIRHLGWVSGLGEIFLTPVGTDATFVFWREELEPPLGVVGGLGLLLFKPFMTRIFRRDLRVLAALGRVAHA
ncbi:MAG: SRPBCC family protein [Actinomycetota bacterium]|nr:SRPBCC family protein [Actinomycetota bacterium]